MEGKRGIIIYNIRGMEDQRNIKNEIIKIRTFYITRQTYITYIYSTTVSQSEVLGFKGLIIETETLNITIYIYKMLFQLMDSI